MLWAYLIGLTYVAKQENLDRLGNLWPLLFLAAPFVWSAQRAASELEGAALYVVLLAVVTHAVGLLRGRATARIPRAVTLLLAGISLLDALMVARWSGGGGQGFLVALAFPATLLLQRYVRGT